jgi:predicted ArsR family transcriptional regulator
VAEPPAKASAAAQEGAEAGEAPRDAAQATAASGAAQGASVAVPRPTTRRNTLRGAAQAVLAAWDDGEGERAALAEAIEELRQALAKPGTAPSTSGPGQPRVGTKQAAVLALLRRPEGASGPAIAEATGWAPHTVRGFLAALKKRGVAVQVHERVR